MTTRRTLVAALAVAALVAAAAPAAVSAAGAEPADAGFDALASLIAKIQKHVETTHAITEAKFEKDLARCNKTLEPVQREVDTRAATIREAEAALANATEAERQLTESLGPLNSKLAAAQLEMARMAQRVRDGDADRAEEAHLAKLKAADTAAVVEAVQGIVAKLSAVNVTQFSFREALDSARAGVRDSSLSGMLADAAARAPKQTIIRTGAEQTVLRMRALMNLLAEELAKYGDAVEQNEKEAAQAWKDHRAHLETRVSELFNEIEAATKSKEAIMARAAEERKKQADARGVATGHVADELAVWRERRQLIVDLCDTKERHFRAEEAARNSQGETLSALSRLSAAHADSDYNLGIGGIAIRPVSSCCMKCPTGRPVACGDECLTTEQAAATRCSVGCACAKGDPRLVAWEAKQQS